MFTSRACGKRPPVAPRTSLVEFDATLAEIAEAPFNHYLPESNLSSHGIVGVQPLADGSIAFTTHVGFLYQVAPPGGDSLDQAPAEVRPLGWFHPRGEAYVSSLFTYDGLRYLLGAKEGQPFEWLVFDLNRRTSVASPLTQTAERSGLLPMARPRATITAHFTCRGRSSAQSLGEQTSAGTRPDALRLTPPE